jgi:hypothetical protein
MTARNIGRIRKAIGAAGREVEMAVGCDLTFASVGRSLVASSIPSRGVEGGCRWRRGPLLGRLGGKIPVGARAPTE